MVVCVLTVASSARAQPSEGSGSEPAALAEPEPAKPAPTKAPATTGTIDGTVESPDLDAPLAGATVTIVGTAI